ncbi:hypothetical protein QA639_33805 [Bradyrhizobium pachyrhizi]|uniref:hypothetical protein n=1 Tax=Bradyrhizobium pachyrhizi TaxID=280333 RepID=UPI0024B227EF|nr:hypothetical protein [Bradyrhizobium pachyrhizi]WFU54536.1 hypothetical protein QA639_33805 [Bradyrhizobium pachyrhizi]
MASVGAILFCRRVSSAPHHEENSRTSVVLRQRCSPELIAAELPKSKAFILGTGIPPIIADKIIYYEDKSFLKRLLPAPVPQMPKGRSNALLDAEIKELRSEIAELRVVLRSRPMTDEEVADPSTIPAGASFDFGNVDVDLEGLSEDELKAWTLGYIDAQVIPPTRQAGRKQKSEQHERQA